MLCTISLFSDHAGDPPSAVTAAVAFGDRADDRRAAAGTAVLDDLLGKGDPQHAAVLFGRASAQIALLDGFHNAPVLISGRHAAVGSLRLLDPVKLLQGQKRFWKLRKNPCVTLRGFDRQHPRKVDRHRQNDRGEGKREKDDRVEKPRLEQIVRGDAAAEHIPEIRLVVVIVHHRQKHDQKNQGKEQLDAEADRVADPLCLQGRRLIIGGVNRLAAGIVADKVKPLSRHDLRGQVGASAIWTPALKVHALFHPTAAAPARAGDGLAVQLDDLGIPVVDGFDDPEIFHIQRTHQSDTGFDLFCRFARHLGKLREIDISVQIAFKIAGEKDGVVDQPARGARAGEHQCAEKEEDDRAVKAAEAEDQAPVPKGADDQLGHRGKSACRERDAKNEQEDVFDLQKCDELFFQIHEQSP